MMRSSRLRRGVVPFLTLQFWVSLGVMAFFFTMIFLLWKRETGLRTGVNQLDISPDLLSVTWVDYDQFMWIQRAGKTIGAYALLVRRNPDFKSYEMTTQARIVLPVFNNTIPVKFDVYVTMNSMFDMETFQAGLNAAGEEIRVDAFTDGLKLYFHAAGPPALIQDGSLASVFNLDQPLILKDAIRPIVAVTRKLEVGDKWTAVASNPMSGTDSFPVEVEVVALEEIVNEGQKIMAHKVIERAKDVATTSWYDEQGFVVRTDMGNGLVLERTRRQDVENAYPELQATLIFPEIDKDALRTQAATAPQDSNASVMPEFLKGIF